MAEHGFRKAGVVGSTPTIGFFFSPACPNAPRDPNAGRARPPSERPTRNAAPRAAPVNPEARRRRIGPCRAGITIGNIFQKTFAPRCTRAEVLLYI